MLKLSTIEELKSAGIIELTECDKSEKETNDNVVRDNKTNKYYKILQNEEEIKIELLTSSYKCLSTIKTILVFFTVIFILYILYIVSILIFSSNSYL